MTQVEQTLNEELACYTEKNCGHLYCQIREDGRIHLDGFFKFDELIDIISILTLEKRETR